MAVSEHDLRRVADLARLGVPASRVPQLVAELNGILAHMEVLNGVNTEGVACATGVSSGGMPLRADTGLQYPLAAALETFAPATRDGFLLVPRLDTHAAAGATADGMRADGTADTDAPILDGLEDAPDAGEVLGADAP
jgi:aspartyl-tRNA(Asn)/glutamyl-tRNA(Gln) amidotransferase subunit C